VTRRAARTIACLLVAALTAIALAPLSAAAAPAGPDIFTQMADQVAAGVLASPAVQAKTGSGRKVRIVIGDVTNDTDNDGVRVDDLSNEIRNQIVGAGVARLFAAGAIDVDFIISPELTSTMRDDGHGRRRCYTLNLTLSTASGEFVAATSASRCS